jgi:aminoglycoside 3-N-acetyltransferase I
MLSSPYSVRALSPADVPLFRQLNELFGVAFNEADTYGAWPPDDRYLEKLLSRRHIIVIVALSEGQVVAGVVAYELEKFESQRSEFYIYDLAVDERHRRRHVATAMIEHLREIAARRGGWLIFVQADYEDNPAIALYNKLGVREEVLHFVIPFGAR